VISNISNKGRRKGVCGEESSRPQRFPKVVNMVRYEQRRAIDCFIKQSRRGRRLVGNRALVSSLASTNPPTVRWAFYISAVCSSSPLVAVTRSFPLSHCSVQ
jgi:hypothetical protein